MFNKWQFFIIVLFFPIVLYANDKYKIKLIVKEDSVHISTEISFIRKVNYLILNNTFDVHHIIDNKDTLKIIEQKSDTIFLNCMVSNVQISYSCAIEEFQLKDGSIILKNEGKWIPSIRNHIINAEINVSFDKSKYISVITNDSIIENAYYLNNTTDVSLFLLPKVKYSKTILKKNDLTFSIFHAKTEVLDITFMNEFFDSFSFYNSLFETEYHKLNLVYIKSKEFNICQSLNRVIIFGDYFYKIYKYDTIGSWIPHEIAHQWWGKGVFFDSKSKNYRFIEESVTEFIKTIFVKEKYGEDEYQKLLNRYKKYYDYVVKDSISKPISDVRMVNTQVNGIIIYSKGPLLLSKIDSIFLESNLKFIIKRFYKKYNGQITTFSNLNKMINDTSNDCSKNLIKMLDSRDKFW